MEVIKPDRRAFLGLISAAALSGLLFFGRSSGAAPIARFPVQHLSLIHI